MLMHQDSVLQLAERRIEMNRGFFEKWIRGYALLIILNITCYYLASAGYLNISVSIFAIGVINYFASVIIINYENQKSRNPEQMESDAFCNGEFRRAITSSFVTVYIAMIALVSAGKQSEFLNSSVMTEFTHLVELVVLFYFGATILQRIPAFSNMGKTVTSLLPTGQNNPMPLSPALTDSAPLNPSTPQIMLTPLPQS